MKIATALVKKQSLIHNLKYIKKIAPNSRIISIVKSNAYGHGLIGVSNIIQNLVDAFGVARLDEALIIRRCGITKPIILLEGFLNRNELSIIIKNKIDTIVHNIEQLKILETFQSSKKIKVWMKLDVGMNRIGILPKDAENFYKRLKNCKNIVSPINIISHFSAANIPNSRITNKQINIYKQFILNKMGEKSISASAGILFYPKTYYDWIRPGLITYGVSPQINKTGSQFNLQPVMTLKTTLIAIRKYSINEYVGYGEVWRSNKNTYLGVIAIGYGDGYLNGSKTEAQVLINGRKVPIIGKISMDMTIVDLGLNHNDKVGDEVILWGKNLPVEETASKSNISSYELLSKLTSRIKIEYTN